MCGRYALTSSPEVIAERFNLLWLPEISAHYNIAPDQMIPVVLATPEGRRVAHLKWGLIPSWATDPAMGARLINARAESLADKPAFRNAYRKRHCLIPADAFYEWKPIGARKQPYYIYMADKKPFAMGGLWEYWINAAGETVETCVLITTDANELLAKFHGRMPLIIRPGDYDAWLDASNPMVEELLKPFPSEEMRCYPVSYHVNKAANDDPECIKPIEEPDQ